MAFPASRRSLGQLFRQGWNEIPEIMATTVLAIAGIGMATYGCYKYSQVDGDNRRYKMTYVIMRPDDPKVAKIKKDTPF
ncbi:hypothetical protein JYU34_011176 [Plutella xylostella]|uniref:Uncharacterized protein n=1 Tax=Plutella xylostella TaxID=51655 RepID=A0ABQ7QJW5_PLUXY|nr:hypothetical protein JYU34_011176 [Plutella xylostella]